MANLEQLKQDYIVALNRLSEATRRQQEVGGPIEPLKPGQEPSVITSAERKAQNECRDAWFDYVRIRDIYWQTRWGVEGNPTAPAT